MGQRPRQQRWHSPRPSPPPLLTSTWRARAGGAWLGVLPRPRSVQGAGWRGSSSPPGPPGQCPFSVLPCFSWPQRRAECRSGPVQTALHPGCPDLFAPRRQSRAPSPHGVTDGRLAWAVSARTESPPSVLWERTSQRTCQPSQPRPRGGAVGGGGEDTEPRLLGVCVGAARAASVRGSALHDVVLSAPRQGWGGVCGLVHAPTPLCLAVCPSASVVTGVRRTGPRTDAHLDPGPGFALTLLSRTRVISARQCDTRPLPTTRALLRGSPEYR